MTSKDCWLNEDCIAGYHFDEINCAFHVEPIQLPDPSELTPEESEVARRYFAGEADIEELRPIMERQLKHLLDNGYPDANR